jgi:hypothetical protein
MSEPLYVITREDVEVRAGRPITDDEAHDIAKCIEFSSVGECIEGAIEQVIGVLDDTDDCAPISDEQALEDRLAVRMATDV